MSQLFVLPKQLNINANLQLVAGAKAYFYKTGTTSPQDTYQDADLTTPHTNPVQADSAGVLPPIYLDDIDPDKSHYRLTLKTASDTLIYTVDPIDPFVITQATIGRRLYPGTQTEIVAGIIPVNYAYPVGNVLRYGADPTETSDSTTAFNSAIAAIGVTSFGATHHAYADGGNFRIDGTVTIPDSTALFFFGQTKLIRKAVFSGNTAPVIHIKGNYAVFDAGGGSVWTENNSPDGVVACGHTSITTSNWNSQRWRFANCRVYTKDFGGAGASPYPGALDGLGVYIPSSQPELGSSYANYFGTVENVHVENATTAFMLTDIANGHVLSNCTVRGFYHYAFRLHGASGNILAPGFVEIPYKNGVIVVLLSTKIAPLAPHASSAESSRNIIASFALELSGSSQVGVRCEALCQFNRCNIAFNASGTPVVDLDGANEFHSDQDTFTNKNITAAGLLSVSRTAQEAVAINSSHASGLAIRLKSNGTTFGSIGSSATLSSGAADELEVLAAANKNLSLKTTGTGIVKLQGAKYTITNLQNFANDAAASAGGVAVGEMYRNGSVIQVRVS